MTASSCRLIGLTLVAILSAREAIVNNDFLAESLHHTSIETVTTTVFFMQQQGSPRSALTMLTPGCSRFLRPDVPEYLTTTPPDPAADFEALRRKRALIFPVAALVECYSDSWRPLYSLLAGATAHKSEQPAQVSVSRNVHMADGQPGYQGEVTIAVNPNNPQQLVAGSNSWHNDLTPACQSPAGGQQQTRGTLALFGSSNGGDTWTHVCAPWDRNVTGGIPNATLWTGSDPALAWDHKGTAYAVYMLNNHVINARDLSGKASASGTAIVIAKSTNSGQSWSNLGVIINHETDSKRVSDKPMVAIDTTTGQAYSHAGRIYVIWSENGRESVAYSDNGINWTATFIGAPFASFLTNSENGGALTVGHDGAVYAVWNTVSTKGGINKKGELLGDSLYVKKSTDGGQTWPAPHANPIRTHILASDGSNNKPAAQDQHAVNSFPSVDADRNPSSIYFGNTYIAYNDFRPGTATGNDLNVYLITSTNGGASWSSVVPVNDDGGTSTQFLPWISVDQSDGSIHVSWLDTRNSAIHCPQSKLADTCTQTFSARSIDGGNSFEENVLVDDFGTAFGNHISFSNENSKDNPNYNRNQYGEYQGIAAANRIAHPIWTDTRSFYPSPVCCLEDAATSSIVYCSAPDGPPAPSTSTALNPARVHVSWVTPNWGSNATGGTFSVYRSTAPTFPTAPPLVSGVTGTSYDDVGGSPNVTYYYFVRATNNCRGTALTPMASIPSVSPAVTFPDSSSTNSRTFWCETEFLSNPYPFNGLWLRRGSSTVFDANWTRIVPNFINETVSAVLDISLNGNAVQIRRASGSDGNICDYVGSSSDGVHFSGTYACALGTFAGRSDSWTATLNGENCAPQLSSLPDVWINKTDASDPILGGRALTYTLTVGNMGGTSAENVAVMDTLPEGLTNPACSRPCTISGNAVAVTIGTILPSAEVTFAISGTAPVINLPVILRNAVGVTTSSAESSTVNNQITQSTTVNPASVDAVGNYWCETEYLSNVYPFVGLWVRRGSTNVFDADWVRAVTGEAASAVLEVSLVGTGVTAHRASSTGPTCDYSGTTTDGVTFAGTYQCISPAVNDLWIATINGACGIPTVSPYR
jgi:uncharacterized repeat protein (TIGR01451 family)